MMVIKEDLIDIDPEVTAKQLENLEEALNSCVSTPHPLNTLGSHLRGVSLRKAVIKEDEPPSPESRHKYIPPWWQGEEEAYRNAQAAMGGISTLPKMQT